MASPPGRGEPWRPGRPLVIWDPVYRTSMGIGPAAGQDRATCLALAGPLWHPRSRSGRSALTASTVSRPSMLGPDAWSAATSGAAQGERGAGERGEKRREEKGGASPSSLLVDGAPGRALASLGLRGSYRTRGLRPHPISACPVIDVDQLRWIPPPPPPPP